MKKTVAIVLMISIMFLMSGCSVSKTLDEKISENTVTTRSSYGQGNQDAIMAEIGVTDTVNKRKMVYSMTYVNYNVYYVINFYSNGSPYERLEYYFYPEENKDDYYENKDSDYYDFNCSCKVLNYNDDQLVVVARSKSFVSNWDICEKRYEQYIIY